MECKHVWQGGKDGVVCLVCGKRLTHEEFIEWLSKEKPKKKTKKKGPAGR